MSSTTTARLLTRAPSAKEARMTKAPIVDATFAAEWNALDKDRRRQVRRLVRIGRPQEDAADAALAVGFAAYQRSRPWYRFFWLWIVPLAVAGLIAASSLHPVAVGMVLGAVGSAVVVRRNFRRVAKVNASLVPAAG